MKAVSLSFSTVSRFCHSLSSCEASSGCSIQVDQMLTFTSIIASDSCANENGVSPTVIIGVVW